MGRPRPRPAAALTSRSLNSRNLTARALAAPARTALALVVLALGAAVALAEDAPSLRAMHWAARDADPVRAFATEPGECLRRPRDPEQALQVEVGRAAFRTPVLLGGQAARAGLACETCHRDGRNNPDFQFPGISGAPGTADVTNSLFSTHRGDGIDNPKPIPDLGGDKARLKISQAPGDPALAQFIHGLITEEFDGPEPPAAVLQGLVAYVRALDPAACPPTPREPLSVARLMDDARRAVAAASAEARRGDAPAAVLLLAGARARLGQIDERFAGPRFASLRARLRQSSARLAEAQAALRQGARPPTGRQLAAWTADARGLEADLRAAEPGSLFDPARLSQAAKRRLPG